jgi:hypothetical protein
MFQSVLLEREKRCFDIQGFTTTSSHSLKRASASSIEAEASELVAPIALANAGIEMVTREKIDRRRLLGGHASSRSGNVN